MVKKTGLALCAVLTTAACGGSGSAVNSIGEYADRQTALFDRIDGAMVLNATDLAPVGSASFTGVAAAYARYEADNGFDQVYETAYVGDLTIDVDIDGKSLTGEATDFIEISNLDDFFLLNTPLQGSQPVSGTMTLTGSLDESPSSAGFAFFDIEGSGRLEGQDGTVLDISGTSGVATMWDTSPLAMQIRGAKDATVAGRNGAVGFDGIAGQ